MTYDLLVIGGGINGAAIARDAAGRGWNVLLVEKDDLAGHTSSASSKLIHGGIRYLEYYEFRLVREALKERAVMLAAAPHLIRPMRFVMPHNDLVRPWWMIRAGLWLYDLMGGWRSLRRTRTLGKASPRYRSPLRDIGSKGFVYSDCWVDDARLVIANALDAREKGAEIVAGTELLSARREGDVWRAEISDGRTVAARAIVNAAGPWVCEVLSTRLGLTSNSALRLVRGSHIVVPRLYVGDHAYILQQPDRRVVFAMPFMDRFTLIGTTDVPVEQPGDAVIDAHELDYLCRCANLYFAVQIHPEDVIHHYAGVRSLYDDGSAESMEVTRDYVLETDRGEDGRAAPAVTLFGGKITTARALAEEAVDELGVAIGLTGEDWTKRAPFPGGDLGMPFDAFLEETQRRYPWLEAENAERMARAYGTRIADVVGDAQSLIEMGEDFGGGFTRREVDHLIDREWARTIDDLLWRRSKMGLLIGEDGRDRLARYLEERSA
ncbi:MAG: glycerol-3-phosphate dehydrogenase [Parasphingopyxis sp.]|nr:glycerol-3-phosphate dehydrogenase [Sphingomonadales bacterium]